MIIDFILVVSKLTAINLHLLLRCLLRLEVFPVGAKTICVREVVGGRVKFLVRLLPPHVVDYLGQVLRLGPLETASLVALLDLVVEVEQTEGPASIDLVCVVLRAVLCEVGHTAIAQKVALVLTGDCFPVEHVVDQGLVNFNIVYC